MNSKSDQIISSFSALEITDLLKFIKFAYPTKSHVLIRLIKYVRKVIRTQEPFNKEHIFCQLFPGEKYKDVKLRLLQSEVLKVAEHFIAYQSLGEDTNFYQEAILKFYYARNQRELYKKELAKLERKVRAFDQFREEHLNLKVLLAEKIYESAMLERKLAQEETEELHRTLDYNFILKKMRICCLVASQEKVYNLIFDQGLRDYILNYIEESELYNDPAIGVYYYCHQMLQHQKDFDKFRAYLNKYSHLFSEEENKELFTLAINFCIRGLNQGDLSQGELGLVLYKDGLQKGILLSHGKISRFTFRNIVTMAIRLGAFDEAQHFIDEYKDLLDSKDKKNMISFTTALVLFAKREYDAADRELLEVNFKDILFNLASKALQLKIYYETEEWWVLKSHLDAMQIFLKRHKSLGYHKQNYLELIALTRKLINARTLEKNQKLKEQLEAKHLMDKDWLIEKVDQNLKVQAER